MLYAILIKYEDVMNLNCATYDYLDTDEQKYLIINKIKSAENYFTEKAKHNLYNWIDNEINYEAIRKLFPG